METEEMYLLLGMFPSVVPVPCIWLLINLVLHATVQGNSSYSVENNALPKVKCYKKRRTFLNVLLFFDVE
jgi:hypothetical protein